MIKLKNIFFWEDQNYVQLIEFISLKFKIKQKKINKNSMYF